MVSDPAANVVGATRLANHAVSAGPVVALVGIVAAATIVLVVVVSYVFHHRSPRATQDGANPSFSHDPGKDEFSR